MDSSTTETVAQTVKGLAILAAIPVVLFALWADYFGRHLKNARKSTPGFDPKFERERVRIAAACALLFEFVLGLGSLNTLQHYPEGTVIGLLACLLTVGFIQAGLEKQLVPVSLSAEATAASARRGVATGSRALLLAVLSGLLYVVTLICFIKAGAWISSALHFSNVWGAAFVMAAAAAGIFCGLALNFALAPWQMRHSLPVTPVTSDEGDVIWMTLENAGLKGVSCWIVEERHGTAAIAGFRRGSGIFRPALFISRSVMTSLTKDEITAVVAHEAAHALARHLRKRVMLSASLIISLTLLAVFMSLAAFMYFPGAGMQGGFGMIFGMTAFAMAFLVLQKQNRVHEFEADWIAIHKLGADYESWASALRKMDQLNGFTTRGGAFSSHPRTEIRIQNVAKMIEYFALARKDPAKAAPPAETKEKDRAA